MSTMSPGVEQGTITFTYTTDDEELQTIEMMLTLLNRHTLTTGERILNYVHARRDGTASSS